MKKLLISFLLGLTIFFSFVPYLSPVKAQTTWYNQSFDEWYGKVYDPDNPGEIFGERYTAAQVQWIVYGLFSFLVNSATGPENSEMVQCFLTNAVNINACADVVTKNLGSSNTQSQALASSKSSPRKNLWGLIFNPDRPISGISYINERVQTLKLVPTAHAQTVGYGFTMLEPIRKMWVGVRDIAYGLFVIVTIISAFMVMFRVKISPQVVISIQSAIPKIVIALILVTFSYAIAGFLIDLMYVVIGLISLALSPFVWGGSTISVFNWLTTGQPFDMNVNWGVLVSFVIYLFAFAVSGLILLIATLGLVGSVLTAAGISFVAGLVSLTGLGTIILIIILIIVVVVILVMLFKILFGLLKAFANIILLTIFAPLQLMAGVVVPNLGFGAWVKSFIGSLSVFVVTGVLMLFSFIFLEMGISVGLREYAPNIQSGISNALFGAGFSSIWTGAANYSAAWPPLLGGGNSGPQLGLLILGVSFVIFTLIPKANEIVQGFISGKPFAYGSAVGEAVAPIGWGYNQVARPVVENVRKRLYDDGKDSSTKIVGVLDVLKDRFKKPEPGGG